MTEAQAFLEKDAATPLGTPRVVQPGDIFLRMWHGNLISTLVGFFQKKGDAGITWSHAGVVIGPNLTAESTLPHGGTFHLTKSAKKNCTLAVIRLGFMTHQQAAAFTAEASRLAPLPYDTGHLWTHLIDNLIERLFWNDSTQSGPRPLSRFFKDKDGASKNVCSEMVERALFAATRMKFQSGQVGEARPDDIWDAYRLWNESGQAKIVFFAERGAIALP